MVTKCPIALHLVGKSAQIIALNIHIYIRVFSVSNTIFGRLH